MCWMGDTQLVLMAAADGLGRFLAGMTHVGHNPGELVMEQPTADCPVGAAKLLLGACVDVV